MFFVGLNPIRPAEEFFLYDGYRDRIVPDVDTGLPKSFPTRGAAEIFARLELGSYTVISR